MDQTTIDRLYKINQGFYETIAEPFNSTRQLTWAGWDQVLETIKKYEVLPPTSTILDLGCGNGRWGKYLFEKNHLAHGAYVGVDENQTLLQYACRDLLSHTEVLHFLHENLQTFLERPATAQLPLQYDLIVLFGVWHHLPGKDNRAKILQQLARLLKPKGLLVISCWRFLRSAQLQARLVVPQLVGINQSQLEAGDNFLDWRSGPQASRYCHDTDRSELMPQARRAGLHLCEEFSADGKTGDLNDYYCLALEQLLATAP